jgi:hypothetical protein
MVPKRHNFLILVVVLVFVLMAGGLIYSILYSRSQLASLNYIIHYQGEQQKQEKADMTTTVTALESTLSTAQAQNNDLTRQSMETSSQLAAATDEVATLKNRLMCVSTIPFVDYTDDGTVSTALKEFTSDYKVTDDHYEAVQKNAKISFHNLKSTRTQSFFMVYFKDPENGRVNGIFDILGQCWVNLNNQ